MGVNMQKKANNFMKNYGSNGQLVLDANSAAGGLAFLEGQLEKIDPKLREPLKGTWWPRDIVAKTGGGWVEYTSTYDVSYATTGGNEDGIINGLANNIPVMQVDISKDLRKVFTWANALRTSYVDQQKFQKLAFDIENQLNKGLKLAYDKTLDKNVYRGLTDETYGLINNPDVTAVMASTGASSNTEWSAKTPDEILVDVNKIMTDTWKASGYDLSGMANHILVPPAQYAYMVSQKISEAGNISVLTYLLENNIGKNQGVDLFIGPLPMLESAGTGGTDRMIGYANDEDRIRLSITVPFSRAMTSIDGTNMCYVTNYVSQFGQVEFLYLQPIEYMDGI